MTKQHIYVLGTGLSHDGSACLIKDGHICAAIEKERITRIKHDGGNDRAAIQYCLDSECITLEDLTLVVQNANFGKFERGNSYYYGPRAFTDDSALPIVTISHHLAHAYSALGLCPFENPKILVVDGCGNGLDECSDIGGADIPIPVDPENDIRHLYFEKDSYYAWSDDRMQVVYKDFSPWGMRMKGYTMLPNTTKHSIGGIYAAASNYCFRDNSDQGKLMGLAPYGRPGVFTDEIFEFKDGRVFVRYDWMSTFTRPALSHEHFKQNFQYYADVAYWVQREVERALLYLVDSRYEMQPGESLAYAGGVALNAVANALIQKHSKFRKLFMVPAAGDNGIAVGCAYYGWLEVLQKERVLHSGTPFLGRNYGWIATEKALEKTIEASRGGEEDVLVFEEDKEYINRTAQFLAEGKVVAWYQDEAEFGPRALGHRSILADPRRLEVRDVINLEIKRREEFRPFAPSVLLEDASTYFDCDFESPYMILVVQVRPEWQTLLGSVVHCDGSARLQTVTRDWNEKYYELLAEFKRRTGISVVLNTSLNRRGMPIVETPKDALNFFKESPSLDVLVIGQYIVTRTGKDSQVGALPSRELSRDQLSL